MECFVPAEQFEPFLSDLRKIVPQSGTDLLNVTVRHVNQDNDTFLRYADRDMIALVMLFHQTRDNEGEKKMAEAARDVISAALNRDGRYYLPYRLHATKEQFAQAYPQAGSFFALKRSYDPEELFQNAFYQRYGK
jgi:FAD/FMN-containing dehydrogenase